MLRVRSGFHSSMCVLYALTYSCTLVLPQRLTHWVRFLDSREDGVWHHMTHSAAAGVVAALPRSSGVRRNTGLHTRLAALSGFDPLTHLRTIVLAALLQFECAMSSWAHVFDYLLLASSDVWGGYRTCLQRWVFGGLEPGSAFTSCHDSTTHSQQCK